MTSVGVDMIEIARVRRALRRHGDRFLARIFTPAEIAYCARRRDPAPSLAARFAAKEAFAKAAPAGAHPTWREVEVVMERGELSEESGGGKPELRVSSRLAQVIGGRRILISLTHSRDLAMAAVIIT
jgi:holo-[acyl-carrier protein] synthase